MATLAYSENIEQMAKELDFGGVKGLIKDVLATQILTRISGFSEEVEGFEARYGKDSTTLGIMKSTSLVDAFTSNRVIAVPPHFDKGGSRGGFFRWIAPKSPWPPFFKGRNPFDFSILD